MPRPHQGRKRLESENPDLGFQIAPMIDLVFVIMLFFMSMAATVKVERELKIALPSGAAESVVVNLPDEQIVEIDEAGEVLLNGEALDMPGSKELPNLRETLKRLKEAGRLSQTALIVTLVSHERAAYARTVDVLDALAVAKITDVTYSVSTAE